MSYSFFLATTILLNIMPGPAMLFVAQQTILRGIRGGILSIAGIELGTLLHIVASVLGLSVVIANSTFLYVIIQYISAIFLIYLGVIQIYQSKKFSLAFDNISSKKSNHYSTFLKATLINTFNPKVLIFFIALLPQAIQKDDNHLMKIIIFGGIFGLCGGVINFILMYFLNNIISNFMKEQSRYSKIIQLMTQVISVILILFGLGIFILKILNC